MKPKDILQKEETNGIKYDFNRGLGGTIWKLFNNYPQESEMLYSSNKNRML